MQNDKESVGLFKMRHRQLRKVRESLFLYDYYQIHYEEIFVQIERITFKYLCIKTENKTLINSGSYGKVAKVSAQKIFLSVKNFDVKHFQANVTDLKVTPH